jgi:competence protein ComEA
VGEVSKQQLVVYAAAALAIALVGARYLKEEQASSSPPAKASRSDTRLRLDRAPSRVVVHVAGAVRRPGVYRLPGWARLNLAIRRAGGAGSGADLGAVNLAAKLADGQQIIVPRRGTAAAMGVGGAEDPGSAEGAPVSLNTATAEQLDELDGVGPVTAEKILDWRKQHGGFSSTEDLKQISGIGPKRFAALKDKVRM